MRFTIRDLLWLMVVAALAVGWWLHDRAWARKFSAEAAEKEVWQARTGQLEIRVDLVVEQLSRLRANKEASRQALEQKLPSESFPD